MGHDALTRAGRIRANTDRAVPRGDTMRGCDAILAAMAIESADEQLAALHVRRLANRHGCGPQGCPDPGAHAAEVESLGEALGALALPATLGTAEPGPEPEPRPGPVRPPVRRAGSQVWREKARCRGTDPELFFGPDGERQKERSAREEKAAEVCARCPVAAQCLTYSLRGHGDKIEAGFWAGMDEEQRQAEKRRRTRRGEIAA